MYILICDICDKEYNPHSGESTRLSSLFVEGAHGGFHYDDICPDCSKKVLSVLKEIKA